MRTSKSKSELKTLTNVSAIHPTPEETSTVIDGRALLWIPQWPSSTSTQKPTIMDFVRKFKHHIQEKLKDGGRYLVFHTDMKISVQILQPEPPDGRR